MIDYTEKIPNNVDLGRDRVLQRALEHWQPAYMSWWYDMGPTESHNYEVYLRTAITVEPDGWAKFGYVRMPEYRWGIFLQPRNAARQVNFGAHKGDPAWQEVPGEYRSTLRRVIVTQGDTEPASVEQQRMLGMCCPSLYDLRNIFQVNVEEGRHLWAMVYLLHRYFGRDGRDAPTNRLHRRQGQSHGDPYDEGDGEQEQRNPRLPGLDIRQQIALIAENGDGRTRDRQEDRRQPEVRHLAEDHIRSAVDH